MVVTAALEVTVEGEFVDAKGAGTVNDDVFSLLLACAPVVEACSVATDETGAADVETECDDCVAEARAADERRTVFFADVSGKAERVADDDTVAEWCCCGPVGTAALRDLSNRAISQAA